MKKLVIATALAVVLASPALAQSYDPDLGSGNVRPQGAAQHLKLHNALGAYAQVPNGSRVIVESSGADANLRFQLNRESEQGRW